MIVRSFCIAVCIGPGQLELKVLTTMLIGMLILAYPTRMDSCVSFCCSLFLFVLAADHAHCNVVFGISVYMSSNFQGCAELLVKEPLRTDNVLLTRRERPSQIAASHWVLRRFWPWRQCLVLQNIFTNPSNREMTAPWESVRCWQNQRRHLIYWFPTDLTEDRFWLIRFKQNLIQHAKMALAVSQIRLFSTRKQLPC